LARVGPSIDAGATTPLVALAAAEQERALPAALDLVELRPLMERTSGRPEIAVALVDGPIVMGHPDLAGASIREVPGRLRGTCDLAGSAACRHGTFVAGVLIGRRGSPAPAICHGCTLLVRPIFAETASGDASMPSAAPEELAAAIVDAVEAGARVINLSVAVVRPSRTGEQALTCALDHAARRGVITVAAAGNDGSLGSSAITRHPWVVPVAACDRLGRPLGLSTLGGSIGRRGLSAPGERITSLGTGDAPHTLGGTSAAAPFVTGAIALLWSEFPAASAADVRFAATGAAATRRRTVIPPLLDAWAAHRVLATTQRG
jgi:subtilisin family serine protease